MTFRLLDEQNHIHEEFKVQAILMRDDQLEQCMVEFEVDFVSVPHGEFVVMWHTD